jgi:hypothetical protein
VRVEPNSWPALRRVTLVLCADCLGGSGGECHTPGCALWFNRAPDVPLVDWCDTFEVVEVDEKDTAP